MSMSVNWLISIAVICHYFFFSSATSNTFESLNICENSYVETCQQCMALHPDCVWIIENDFDDSKRCTIKSNTKHSRFIEGHKIEVELIENKGFVLPSNDQQKGVQIRPQKIRITLRHKEPVNFLIRYKALPNYPLDIYYLLDQTYSMEKHKENLVSLTKSLGESLKSLTEDYRISFGYFSDKVLMPYYSTVEKAIKNPCILQKQECVPGMNFVHSLNFTNNVEEFIKHATQMNFTGNLDDAEGSFDALLQIILCQKELKWRNYARKMIILATDGWIHFAGDGLLGGVVKKHPSICNMEYNDGIFNYGGKKYDYPSVEEVYRNLLAAKTSLVLAVQEKANNSNAEYFKTLTSLMDEVTLYAKLDDEPDRIIEAVESGFRDKIKKVVFKVANKPKYLDIVSWSFCNDTYYNQTWSCWNARLDTEYVFNITVNLNELPKHGKNDTFFIEEVYNHERIEIAVVYAEWCACESNTDTNNHATVNGVYQCGKYLCNQGWTGKQCDRKCDVTMSRYQNESYTSHMCTGHGYFDSSECHCICDAGYSGKFCEELCVTDKFGNICSNNGVCRNNQCECYTGFSGELCACRESNATCITSGKELICSNHGQCKCGTCVCTDDYFGEFCQHCRGCYKCVYDEVLNKHLHGNLTANDYKMYTFFEASDNDNDLRCQAAISGNITHYCSMEYSISNEGTLTIRYSEKCYLRTMLFATTAAITISICLTFLLILFVWRILIWMKDRSEWAQYEKNKQGESFQDNKLYKSPITSYEMPIRE